VWIKSSSAQKIFSPRLTPFSSTWTWYQMWSVFEFSKFSQSKIWAQSFVRCILLGSELYTFILLYVKHPKCGTKMQRIYKRNHSTFVPCEWLCTDYWQFKKTLSHVQTYASNNEHRIPWSRAAHPENQRTLSLFYPALIHLRFIALWL
jgi:hypothetical protein